MASQVVLETIGRNDSEGPQAGLINRNLSMHTGRRRSDGGGGGGSGGRRGGMELWERRAKEYFGKEEIEIIREMRKLLATNDRPSDCAVARILEDRKWRGVDRFDDIYQGEKPPPFAALTAEVPDGFGIHGEKCFADYFARNTGMGKESVVLDVGSGYLRDSQRFAQTGATVHAVDASAYAIEKGQQYLEKINERWAKNIHLERGNFRDMLKSPEPAQLTHVHGFSAFHYEPRGKLAETVADIYRKLEPGKGYLGIAIKTPRSAAASAADQIPLSEYPWHYRLSGSQRVFRMYPSINALEHLLWKKGFSVEHKFSGNLEGYEKKGVAEEMRYIIARVMENRPRGSAIGRRR